MKSTVRCRHEHATIEKMMLRAAILAVAALGSTTVAGHAGAEPAATTESTRYTLTQFDGTPPFGEHGDTGTDTGPSDDAVRLGDTVTYVLDIAVGTTVLADAQVNLPIPDALVPGRVSNFCLPGSALVVGADHRQSLQCRLGDLEAGTILTRAVVARADTPAAVGTAAAPVIATLSSPSLSEPLLSEPVSLRYLATSPACNPFGTPAPNGPDDHDGNLHADGRITVHLPNARATETPVSLSGHDACGHLVARSVTPDQSGRTVFAGLMPGRYRVTTASVDGGPDSSADIVLQSGSPAVDLMLPTPITY